MDRSMESRRLRTALLAPAAALALGACSIACCADRADGFGAVGGGSPVFSIEHGSFGVHGAYGRDRERWYRRDGYGFYLDTLPLNYSVYWWDGLPYYYADGSYYVWDGPVGEYRVVRPPDGLLQQARRDSVR